LEGDSLHGVREEMNGRFDAGRQIYSTTKNATQPPVSLIGQLLWREFFYLCGYSFKNFDKMEGNAICRQIPWGK
jgi:cryptochrome